MAKYLTTTVRIGGQLRQHVATKVVPDGTYQHVREYIRDLIRRDLEASGRGLPLV